MKVERLCHLLDISFFIVGKYIYLSSNFFCLLEMSLWKYIHLIKKQKKIAFFFSLDYNLRIIHGIGGQVYHAICIDVSKFLHSIFQKKKFFSPLERAYFLLCSVDTL